MTGGGSLSLANLALPVRALATAQAGLSGAGSRLALEAVSLVESPEVGALTGTVTAEADGEGLATTGNIPPFFVVLSGPCTTALVDGHWCVGRWPGGYGPGEDCAVAVAGGGGVGGVLGGCPVFDTQARGSTYGDYLSDGSLSGGDYLTLPDGSTYGGSSTHDCPTGAVLAAGQSLAWHSDGSWQGGYYDTHYTHTTFDGLGGGWQVCFDGGINIAGGDTMDLAGDTCPSFTCPVGACTLTVGAGASLSLTGCEIPAEVCHRSPACHSLFASALSHLFLIL
eukprot:SAG22_NODE_503_length_9694_cov_13.573736_2_plen_281_part_00